jgi:hypothetical protein
MEPVHGASEVGEEGKQQPVGEDAAHFGAHERPGFEGFEGQAVVLLDGGRGDELGVRLDADGLALLVDGACTEGAGVKIRFGGYTNNVECVVLRCELVLAVPVWRCVSMEPASQDVVSTGILWPAFADSLLPALTQTIVTQTKTRSHTCSPPCGRQNTNTPTSLEWRPKRISMGNLQTKPMVNSQVIS